MVFPVIGRANHIALALSLALHQQCRSDAIQDPQCQAARGYAEKIRRMISYERSFLRPLFADHFPDLGGVT